MKKSLKRTLLCTALSVIPVAYSYHMYHDLNDQLKRLENQNKQQQKLIKQLQQDVKTNSKNIKESEDRLRQRYDEEIKGIERQIKRIEQIKEKYKNNYIYSFEGIVTAYSPYEESTGKSPNDPNFKKTASGTIATQGRTIAMDKNIPFGTLVKIEGFDGVFIVEDRGSRIKGNRVDVYFENVKDAVEFGKQKRKIFIIKLGKSSRQTK
jgi:3D (Asp-Asp-Asp) domain-containing protein